jgi:hypothetical protein
MTLHFTTTTADLQAFTECYCRDSKSYQAARRTSRWLLPLIFLAMAGYYAWRDGFSLGGTVFFGGLALAWWLWYPRRFDASARRSFQKQFAEPSYAKGLGPNELQLLDEHLYSHSPLGVATYPWSSVDRVVLQDDYLFIFLAAANGFPLRIAEIGTDAAQRAHEFITARIELAKPAGERHPG